MQLQDLNELKSMLEIDPEDTEEDKKLLFLIEYASDMIESILDRKLFYRTGTEYYCGSGTQKLLLNRRPVYDPTSIVVLLNTNGYFGSDPSPNGDVQPLVYGVGYCLQIDNPESKYGDVSNCGILIRIGDYWNKQYVRQYPLLSPYIDQSYGNIQVTYTAGYTFDTLPAQIRMAMVFLVGRLRFLLPVGFELSGDTYEERSVSIASPQTQYLLGMVRAMLFPYKNWTFGGKNR